MRATEVLGQQGEQAGRGVPRRGQACGSWTGTGAAPRARSTSSPRSGTRLVVCEVKTRSSDRYGTPLEASAGSSSTRLRRLAIRWLTAHGVRFDEVRIDVVGVAADPAGEFTVEHVRGVG